MEKKSNRCIPNRAALQEDMRLVWLRHVYWTRMLIISITENIADQSEVAARLMQNPSEIAEIFERFYSTEAIEPIESLLTQHLEIGGKLMTASRDGQTEKVAELTKEWYANADEIAKALLLLNPYYDFEALVEMLHTHLDLTIAQVKAQLAGNYRKSIDEFDEVEREAVAMADMLAEGILRQFPC